MMISCKYKILLKSWLIPLKLYSSWLNLAFSQLNLGLLFREGHYGKAAINCLVHVSFAFKNGAGGCAEAKKFRFFEKHTYCQLVNEHVLLNRCSFYSNNNNNNNKNKTIKQQYNSRAEHLVRSMHMLRIERQLQNYFSKITDDSKVVCFNGSIVKLM